MTKAVIIGNPNPKIERCCSLQAFTLFTLIGIRDDWPGSDIPPVSRQAFGFNLQQAIRRLLFKPNSRIIGLTASRTLRFSAIWHGFVRRHWNAHKTNRESLISRACTSDNGWSYIENRKTKDFARNDGCRIACGGCEADDCYTLGQHLRLENHASQENRTCFACSHDLRGWLMWSSRHSKRGSYEVSSDTTVWLSAFPIVVPGKAIVRHLCYDRFVPRKNHMHAWNRQKIFKVALFLFR